MALSPHVSRRALIALAASTTLLSACGKSDTAAVTPSVFVENPSLPAKIVIGLDDNFPPMGFRDEKNELVGFDIDLARETAKHLGMQVEFKPIDWDAKESELNGKRVDALWNGLTITPEREKNIAFTAPYMENHQIIIVKADSPIKTKADMAGKVIGVQDGSSAIDAINKDAATAQSFKELKKYGDNVTALLDLNTGRIDAVVLDEVVGRYYVAKKPGEYAILEQNFGAEKYGVGVRKQDTALLDHLNRALDEVKKDGSGARISEKWFGKDILE